MIRSTYLLFLLIISMSPAGARDDLYSSEVDGVSDDNLCGPRALATAAMLQGAPVDINALVQLFEYQAAGVSMYALKQVGESYGLLCHGLILDWNKLSRLSGPAILYVSGNHFIVLDPTDVEKRDGTSRIRLYDPPQLARYVDQVELASMWNGETLVVSVPGPADTQKPEGPQVTFDSVLFDFGTLEDSETMHHRFGLRNTGDEVLEIMGIDKSCGCTETHTDTYVIFPGEESFIDVTIETGGKRGKQTESLVVHTNDPVHPSINLLIQGYVERNMYLSRDHIDIRDLHRGEQFEERFEIRSRSPISIDIQPRDIIGSESIRITYDLGVPDLDPQTEEWVTSATISGQIGTDARPGFGETLAMVSLKERPQISTAIPITFSISPMYSLDPSVVSFGIIGGDSIHSRKLVIDGLGAQELDPSAVNFQVVAEKPTAALPQVRNVRHEGGKLLADLDLVLPSDLGSRGRHIVTGRVLVTLQEGEQLSSEWTYLYKGEPRI